MFALADINSFYALCEKVFRPDLRNEPVIVLSNNDGCVIARSPEAKALGIRMGQPWFQVRQMRLGKKIHVFSSNYTLYHSMNQRVMAVLESLSPAVEPYSIDEMFIDLRGVNRCLSPEVFGHQLREQIKSWTGLTMGVGGGGGHCAYKNAGQKCTVGNKAMATVFRCGRADGRKP